LKNSKLKLILQEIQRNGLSGDVYFLETENLQAQKTEHEQTIAPQVNTSGYNIRITLNNRTTSLYFNRFEIDKISTRVRQMKQFLTHQKPRAAFNYPDKSISNFSSDHSLLNIKELNKFASQFGKSLSNQLKMEIPSLHSAQYTIQQTSVSRNLLNTSGLECSDQHHYCKHTLKWTSDILGLPANWVCERFTEFPETEKDLFANAWKYFKSEQSQIPGKLSGSRTVVFEQHAASQFIKSLIPHFNGEKLNIGQSFLTGRKGNKVSSTKLSIQLNSNSCSHGHSCKWDDEGIPVAQKNLLINGVFHDSFDDLASSAENDSSPGCCVRNQMLSPKPGWLNITVKPGKTSSQNLLEFGNTGMLILALIKPQINLSTAQFTSGYIGRSISNATPGPWVINGILSANIFDLLNSVDAIENYSSQYQQISCPAIRISSVKLS